MGSCRSETPANVRWAEACITVMREMAPAQRLRIRRRLAEGWAEVLARSADRCLLVEVLRGRVRAQDGDHGERALRGSSVACRFRRARLDAEDWVHGAEPAKRSSALAFPRRFDGAAAGHAGRMARVRRDTSGPPTTRVRGRWRRRAHSSCRREPHAGDWGFDQGVIRRPRPSTCSATRRRRLTGLHFTGSTGCG
jgi:hypothetical protein